MAAESDCGRDDDNDDDGGENGPLRRPLTGVPICLGHAVSDQTQTTVDSMPGSDSKSGGQRNDSPDGGSETSGAHGKKKGAVVSTDGGYDDYGRRIRSESTRSDGGDGRGGGAKGLAGKGNVVIAELHGLREAMHKDNETTQRQLTGMRDENRYPLHTPPTRKGKRGTDKNDSTCAGSHHRPPTLHR